MDRRLKPLVTVIAAAGLVLLGALGDLAQESTPTAAENPFRELGLPELAITVSDTGIMVDETVIPAGRYLVHFSNDSGNPKASAGFVRLSEGQTLADLSYADEVAAGTPLPEGGAPPSDAEAWLYETYIIGGGSSFSPATVVDLPAGEYGVWAEDPVGTIPAAALTVTGDPEARIEGPEPEAAVTIVEEGAGGQSFRFTVQGELAAGPQVVKVLNASDQPHFIIAFQYPEPITEEQLMAAFTFDPSSGATPAPDMIDMSQMAFAGWVGPQSLGTTQWVTLDLASGQVVLACFVTDPQAGHVPHAFEGMLQLFPVAES